MIGFVVVDNHRQILQFINNIYQRLFYDKLVEFLLLVFN